jgi:AraC family transcriptional regulator, transcriptional activator of pobA
MDSVRESSRRPAIRQLSYRPPDAARSRIEALTFADLRTMTPHLPMRADFCVLAAIDAGHGAVMVDFERRRLDAGTVVLLRPGVVHHWIDIAHVEGNLVLFTPTAPAEPFADVVGGPGIAACWRPAPVQWRLARAHAHGLRLEIEHAVATGRAGGGEVAPFVLAALLRRIAPRAVEDDAGAAERRGGGEVFASFSAAVEEDFRTHHDVAHYARRLGFASRTLSRAAEAATGGTAKAYVSARLILEARRLLAYDGLSATRVAERLGFTDAANFSAFYLRETGDRPGAWQSAQRGQRTERVPAQHER